jgi:protoporphyrinogen/coproporphyrinogen III oxidase
MKHFVILGAGISGLSLGWFLKEQHGNHVKITIVEKANRTGGWIETKHVNGFLFEQGPRSFRTAGNGIEALKLLESLGMADQVIPADPAAKQRFIYKNKQLIPLPTGIFSLMTSPLRKIILKGLWQDWRTPRGLPEDVSIYDFFSRRFGVEVAENFADPLVSGIYAGDIRELSIQSCFPELVSFEQNHGSVLRGFISKKKRDLTQESPFIQRIACHSIFTLKMGVESLIHELTKRLKDHILLSTYPISFKGNPDHTQIELSNSSSLRADRIFSTIPDKNQIPYASVAVVNVGYRTRVLDKAGFGYLIPSSENQKVLGVVWDSIAFPAQNQHPEETRLTVMLGGRHHPDIETMGEERIISLALEALSNHLAISKSPDAIAFKLAYRAIPQYLVGHSSYFQGVSVNDRIVQSKKVSMQL